MSRLLLLALLLLSCVYGISAQDSLLTNINFDNADFDSEISLEGDWTIGDEAWNYFLQLEDAQADDSLLLNDGTDWTNYRLEVDIRLSNGILNLDLRTDEAGCAGYRLIIDTDQETMGLYLVEQDTGECRILDMLEESFNFERDWSENWSHLEISAHHDNLTVSLDGEEILSLEDDSDAQGTIRFSPTEGSNLDIDNIAVYESSNPAARMGNVLRDAEPAIAFEPEAILEALREDGYITGEGEMVVDERDYLWGLQGEGSWFNLFSETSYRDVVVGGEFFFSPSEEAGYFDESSVNYEFCGLMVRIVTSCNCGDVSDNYLTVGFTNIGTVSIFDQLSMSNTALMVDNILNYDYSDPHYLLMVAVDDEVSVFVDGDVVFDRLEAVDRAGAIGMTMEGAEDDSLCQVQDPWAYSLDR